MGSGLRLLVAQFLNWVRSASLQLIEAVLVHSIEESIDP
jgi:hypothetical protein